MKITHRADGVPLYSFEKGDRVVVPPDATWADGIEPVNLSIRTGGVYCVHEPRDDDGDVYVSSDPDATAWGEGISGGYVAEHLLTPADVGMTDPAAPEPASPSGAARLRAIVESAGTPMMDSTDALDYRTKRDGGTAFSFIDPTDRCFYVVLTVPNKEN